MKKLLLAPACITVLAYAVMATNTTPTTTQADDRAPAAAAVDTTLPDVSDSLDGQETTAVGADVITGSIAPPVRWGNDGTLVSYTIGTTSCNIGTVNLNWIQNSTNHPVISQMIYRFTGEGRLEQIGMGWMKHSFCALQNPGCTAGCPGQGGCLSFLAPNCADPYTSSRNGDQTLLGPRFEVNGWTAVYPWPHSFRGVTGDFKFKRIQVPLAELNPALNPGQIVYLECNYTARDDALAGNNFNNTSCVKSVVTGTSPNFNLSLSGSTLRQTAVIERWDDEVPGAEVMQANVSGEGRFFIGNYVRDNGDGTWTYNYAVYNLNSDRSGYSFSVPVPASVTVTNINFNDVNYHSGEPFTNTDWTGVRGASDVTWTADNTFAGNANANALRWGTTYSFWYTANTAPQASTATLTLFKPGAPSSVTASVRSPEDAGGLLGDMNCDGIVSIADIGAFVLAITDPAGYASTFPGCNILNGDINGDSSVGVGDIGGFVCLLTGCP